MDLNFKEVKELLPLFSNESVLDLLLADDKYFLTVDADKNIVKKYLNNEIGNVKNTKDTIYIIKKNQIYYYYQGSYESIPYNLPNDTLNQIKSSTGNKIMIAYKDKKWVFLSDDHNKINDIKKTTDLLGIKTMIYDVRKPVFKYNVEIR